MSVGATSFPDPTDLPTLKVTPTKLSTASASAEAARVKALIAQYKGIPGLVWVDPEYMRAYPSDDKEFFFVYIEAIVKEFADKTTIADEIRNRTLKTLKFEPSETNVIMFDGHTSHNYLWTLREPSWNITQLTAFSAAPLQLTATAVNPNPTQTPVSQVYEPDPVDTGGMSIDDELNTAIYGGSSSGGSGGSQSFSACPVQPDPRNCDEAVAMGLSAEQAALCTGTDARGRRYPLDRNGNGVACYGD